MEESERNLAALTAAPDALEVLAEMNKKKELRSVDHESIDYLMIRKNLYIQPQHLARLSHAEIAVRVRPPPYRNSARPGYPNV